MNKRSAGKAKPKTALWWIGLWATIWWGVTCGFVLVLFWRAKDYYLSAAAATPTAQFFSTWRTALAHSYHGSRLLPSFLMVIIAIWIAGGLLWLRALKIQNIGYRSAFKDLFLTIRR